MTTETATPHHSLPHFAENEIAYLDNNARVLWLFVYAIGCETQCHAGEVGTREAMSWLAPAEFDAAVACLVERDLMVVSEYDDSRLLEAIDPSLADSRDQSQVDHP